MCYKQKCNVVSLNLAHPVDRLVYCSQSDMPWLLSGSLPSCVQQS